MMGIVVRWVGLLAFSLSTFSTLAFGQSVPSQFVFGTRYDLEGRVVGTISADPDGAGGLGRLAERRTYDVRGLLVRVESGALSGWQDESVVPADWAGFSISRVVESVYDLGGRKVRESVSSGGVVSAVTQFSYDAADRLVCSAVRMNPAVFASLPADACVLGPVGAAGADRITRNIYSGARLDTVQKAYATARAQDYARYTYTANGQQASVTDANGNRTEYGYDGFDRLAQTRFPSKVSANTANPADHEAYGYDAAGNRTSLRKRDGSILTYQYDPLNRLSVKIVPERASIPPVHTRDVYYGYDNRGLQLYARFESVVGEGVSSSYDAVGRLLISQSAFARPGAHEPLTHSYDANGNRLRITHADGTYFDHSYDGLDRMVTANWVSKDGLTPGQFMAISHDGFGRRSTISRASSQTGYSYDGIGRLSGLNQYFAGGVGNAGETFAYNPASQITSHTKDNDAYLFSGDTNVARTYAVNGLNQYTTAGPATFSYDANGNLTGDGFNSYTYDIENRLIGRSGGAETALFYDPLGRLSATNGAPHLPGSEKITRFLYDGDALVAEYNGAGTLIHRYMHGPGTDEPILWDMGQAMNCSGTRFLHTNHQGSIIAVADCHGNRTNINAYDEYGIPNGLIEGSPPNTGRFGYTGQTWIPEIGCSYYKARFYCPTLGRFMQTDPIGYDDGLNWYAYAGNDPVNNSDPSGLISAGSCEGDARGNASASCSGGNIISATDAFRTQQANAGKDNRPQAGPLGRAISSLSNAVQEVDNTIDSVVDIASDALDAVTYSLPELTEDITNPNIPSEAYETYNQYKEQNYQFRSGQAYGVHSYKGEGLPKGGNYRSMFVRQFDIGRMFGPQPRDRLIVDIKSGRAYYTPDHYRTFRRLGR